MIARTARTLLPKPARPFRFRGCLFSEKDPVRAPKSRVRFSSTQSQPIIPASSDDKALILLYDHPNKPHRSSPFSRTGLFGHPSLTHPEALIALADATLLRAQVLTERIMRARESSDELKKVVKNLDRLSDLLCGVIDLAELVRNAHPDPIWVDAANTAYERLCEFMNILNTHVGLYDVCKYLNQHLYSNSPCVFRF